MTASKRKGCGHVVSMESIKHRCEVIAPEFRDGDSLGCMTWWTCAKCGAVVPQEEANDEPEAVRIEMRAAELAHGVGNEVDFTDCEWMGWNGDEVYFGGGSYHTIDNLPLRNLRAWHAGWLAAAIEAHDGEQDGERT